MPVSQNPIAAKSTRARTDGRRTLLVYLDAVLIKELKKAALDDEKNAYEIVEQAVGDWLARRSKKIGAIARRRRATRRSGQK